jgi:hypothetical protein
MRNELQVGGKDLVKDADLVEEVWIRRPEKGKKFRGRK